MAQGSHSESTLELAAGECQFQNMSQIDLTPEQHYEANRSSQESKFKQIKRWPARFKQSIGAKMDEAKANSISNTEFLVQMVLELASTIIWILCFICTITQPVFLFFVGLFNLDDCQARPQLPYFVLATGFFMNACNLFNLVFTYDLPILKNHKSLRDDIKNITASIINIVFNCIVVFLYMLIAYMIYTDTANLRGRPSTLSQSSAHQSPGRTAYEPRDDELSSCNPVLYQTTYWFVTITLAFLCILCIAAGSILAYNRLIKTRNLNSTSTEVTSVHTNIQKSEVA